MILHDFTIEYKNTLDSFLLVPSGDWHLGDRYFDRAKWEKTHKAMNTSDYIYTILMGDLGDHIVYSDKRFDIKVVDPTYYNEEDLPDLAGKQYREIRNMLYPMRERVIGVIEGNHELVMRKNYYRDMTLDLCREMNTSRRDDGENKTEHLSGVAMIRLNFIQKRKKAREGRGNEKIHNSARYVLFVTHGSTGSTTIGGKIKYVEEFANSFDADIYMSGHTHAKLTWGTNRRLGLSRSGKLTKTDTLKRCALTGSFLQTYEEGPSSYAENKVYKPLETGCVAFEFRPGKDEIVMYDDALTVL